MPRTRPAVTARPTPFLLLEKIRLFRQTSSFDQAAGIAAQLTTRYPKCAMAWAELAETQWRQRENATLVSAACERALTLDPTLLGARNRLVFYRLVAADWTKAEELLAKNRSINPSDPETRRLETALALLKNGPGKIDKPDKLDKLDAVTSASLTATLTSLTATSSSLTTSSQQILALRMGELYSARSDYRKSLAWFKRALATDPASADALRGAGWALVRQGQFAPARDYLDQAFARDRFDAETKNLLEYMDSLSQASERTEGLITVGAPRGGEALGWYTRHLAAGYLEEEARRYHLTPGEPVRIQLCASTGDLDVVTQGIPSYG